MCKPASFSRYADHPLRQFLAHRLLVTLNTDDPGISNINLEHEYRVAAEQVGVSAVDLLQLQENARQAAFWDSPQAYLSFECR